MKAIVKLMNIGVLAATFLAVSPLAMPLVRQALAPRVVHHPQPVLAPPGVRHLNKVEDLVFAMTNQARLPKGLAPLSKDAELGNVARAYSDDMLVRRFFDHSNPDGVSFDDRLAEQYHYWVRVMGENIWGAFGYNTDNPQKLAKLIVADWMRSPGHRENLLSPDFTHLGVGVSARGQTIRATQEFVGKSKGFSLRNLLSLGP
jgi:uncharacterized protein YkwD